MTAALLDPRTLTDINRNSYDPRTLLSPLWIACHTSESMSRVLNLNAYCKGHQNSYHRLVDDRDILVAVEDRNAPWSAAGANQYAYHVCWSSSFAGWSRGAWLDPSAANDGIDERQALRNGAKVIAYWISKSRVENGGKRAIPAEWIGDGTRPPWGRNGVCGHADFGQWGGGHHDPGINFPEDVLMADVRAILDGVVAPPPVTVPLPPVTIPGTNPNRYADWLEYQGKPNPNRDRIAAIQAAMNRPPTPFGLVVDGDFGPQTRQAVLGFQAHVGLTFDGVVGPATASALRP